MRRGFLIANLHRDDRFHENGVDLLFNKNEISIGFAVKKKPKQEDILQLNTLDQSTLARTKFYVYLDSPTRPFDKAKNDTRNVHFIDWNKLHSLLVLNSSVKYVLLYFAAHKLFQNLHRIYHGLYDKRLTKQIIHSPDDEEAHFLWNLKDDAVKLKSSLELIQATWRALLLQRADYNRNEYENLIAKLHSELDIINSLAGESLCGSFNTMFEKYPHLAACYWELASRRTVWKDFTSTALVIGKESPAKLKEFIRYKWVTPTLEHNRRSTEYGPIASVYSALWSVVESTYHIADDLECGVDWLFSDLSTERNRLR